MYFSNFVPSRLTVNYVCIISESSYPSTALVTLPHISVTKATVTNLVEENKGRAVFSEHEIQVDLEAFGIATIRIRTD
jgi:hypothetical protein